MNYNKTGGGMYQTPRGLARQISKKQVRKRIYGNVEYFCKVWREASAHEKEYLKSCLTKGEFLFIKEQSSERIKLKKGEKRAKKKFQTNVKFKKPAEKQDTFFFGRLLSLVCALTTLLLHFYV
jgi:hypothetical protein